MDNQSLMSVYCDLKRSRAYIMEARDNLAMENLKLRNKITTIDNCDLDDELKRYLINLHNFNIAANKRIMQSLDRALLYLQ